MNTEEQFEQLRKLLKLKRYEQPPPGYFDRLPRQIISAIEREHAQPEPWLRRIWSTLQAQPAFAGAFGLVMCALVVGGILVANKTSQTSGKGTVARTLNSNLDVAPPPSVPVLAQPTPQLVDASVVSSTNPVPSSRVPEFLFNQSLLRSSGVPVNASPR